MIVSEETVSPSPIWNIALDKYIYFELESRFCVRDLNRGLIYRAELVYP